MAAYQRIMRKARAYVVVRNRTRHIDNTPTLWLREEYLNLFNCFFNSAAVSGKVGKHRVHNIRHMRALRLSGVLCPVA